MFCFWRKKHQNFRDAVKKIYLDKIPQQEMIDCSNFTKSSKLITRFVEHRHAPMFDKDYPLKLASGIVVTDHPNRLYDVAYFQLCEPHVYFSESWASNEVAAWASILAVYYCYLLGYSGENLRTAMEACCIETCPIREFFDALIKLQQMGYLDEDGEPTFKNRQNGEPLLHINEDYPSDLDEEEVLSFFRPTRRYEEIELIDKKRV